MLENTFRAFESVKYVEPNVTELSDLEKKLKTKNLSDSKKQTLCDHMEELGVKLDKIYAERIRMMKREDCDLSVKSARRVWGPQ